MRSWIVLGGDGLLGRAFTKFIRLKTSDACIPLSRSAVDITDINSIYDMLQDVVADTGLTMQSVIVVNAAAYTDVRAAEHNISTAMAVNAHGAHNVARICEMLDIPLVHISTDYVFNGSSDIGYTPTDNPEPLNVYGWSKLLGEIYVRETMPRSSCVVRTSSLYAHHGTHFIKKVRDTASVGGTMSVVSDHFAQPTPAWYVSSCIHEIVQSLGLHDHDFTTYHATIGGATTWYMFARAVCNMYDIPARTVRPVPAASLNESQSTLKRPKYSILRSGGHRWSNVIPIGWYDALDHHVLTDPTYKK